MLEEKTEPRYWGESGYSAYCRTLDHVTAIEARDNKNAFSKRPALHHPEEEGKGNAFKLVGRVVVMQELQELQGSLDMIGGGGEGQGSRGTWRRGL